ncbi:pyrophosphatase [Rhizobium sp. TRM95111]|uniref:pyrophosphatase n=1 Tax=Rhizobium alarense TaxID=2846851 RepID=UPI001F34320B|nr:pyrophosphatase [Rhizobium alarense]MCF3640163.1 pyrophosphatase [Rhizobium alarense]
MIRALAESFEAASARYAAERDIARDGDWFLLKLQEEAGELTQVANRLSGRSPAKGHSPEDLRRLLADETADLLGHILLFARHHDVDLAAAIERKWRFRPTNGPRLP